MRRVNSVDYLQDILSDSVFVGLWWADGRLLATPHADWGSRAGREPALGARADPNLNQRSAQADTCVAIVTREGCRIGGSGNVKDSCS